ncbi:VOC family protein [Brachybacterium sp. FME24]|uniref:VOC family protein n=1 Tax=Brachybacterium sp. FME24 TaxID=2742605 RepID=UPI00186948CA|nr:VOC family protein [Brachybacterium sp. FME24]
MGDSDWRVLDGVSTAWFETPSLSAAAVMAGRIAEKPAVTAVDVRTTGLRVRVDSDESAEAVSELARDLGRIANPGALQSLSVVLDSAEPSALRPFWQRALDYDPDGEGRLVDPLRRDPALQFRASSESRPVRHRIHVDVVRPESAVEQADLGEATGPYGIRHADADGNELDLVPGSPLGENSGADEWQAVFSAMACYRVDSPQRQDDLAAAAAALAENAGSPLLIDLRPGLVVLDSGKDLWEAEAQGPGLDFTALAARIQSVARELGAAADSGLLRFVQLVLDAADVAAVRAFWVVALGYVEDRREGVSDIYDPRRFGPELVFQSLDATDMPRRRQRNRASIELEVPFDVAPSRLDTALGAGGRLMEGSDGRWRVADPEGNELVIVGTA